MQAKEIIGSVIDYDHDSVFCEMQTKLGTMEVALPKSLFTVKVFCGMNIKLYIDESTETAVVEILPPRKGRFKCI